MVVDDVLGLVLPGASPPDFHSFFLGHVDATDAVALLNLVDPQFVLVHGVNETFRHGVTPLLSRNRVLVVTRSA